MGRSGSGPLGPKDAGGCIGPNVAGTWYPADRNELARRVDGFLESAPPPAPGQARIRALIAPHAGFDYSGAVAGRGFGMAPLHAERVVLLGPSHYVAFPGGAVPDVDRYRTPLGDVPLDAEAAAGLASRPGLRVDNGPFRPEHSLEAEIPFLQRALDPGWRLVAILIGAGSGRSDLDAVASALQPMWDGATLFVVSSDFTHFGPRFRFVPFDTDVPRRIEQLDMGAVAPILARDPAGFETYVRKTGATICGRDAIGILLRLLPDGVEGSLAAYDTSGRITGSWDHSVSYASVVFRSSAES